jgi:hypothetical protein
MTSGSSMQAMSAPRPCSDRTVRRWREAFEPKLLDRVLPPRRSGYRQPAALAEKEATKAH